MAATVLKAAIDKINSFSILAANLLFYCKVILNVLTLYRILKRTLQQSLGMGIKLYLKVLGRADWALLRMPL